jgi:hypothetical protein
MNAAQKKQLVDRALAERELANGRELAELRDRVVANAGTGRKRAPLWTHVKAATGYGSTRARELCRGAGFDPDEEAGDEPQPGERSQ